MRLAVATLALTLLHVVACTVVPNADPHAGSGSGGSTPDGGPGGEGTGGVGVCNTPPLADGDCATSGWLPGGATKQLVGGKGVLGPITDDGTNVYFAAPGLSGGDDLYIFTDGSPARIIVPGVGKVAQIGMSFGVGNSQLVLYTTQVGSTWQLGGAIASGGNPTPVISGLASPPTALASNSGAFFVSAGSEIIDDSNRQVVDGTSPILGMTVDEQYVYWSTAGEIHRADLMTLKSSVLASGLGQPQSLVVDAANVYWADPVKGRVQAIAIDGSGGVRTIASGAVGVTQMTIDRANAYWSVPAGAPSPGAYFAPLCLCGPTTRVSRDPGSGVTTDGTRVIWIDATTNEIDTAPN